MQLSSLLKGGLWSTIRAKLGRAGQAALQAVHNLKITDQLQDAAFSAVKAAEAGGGSGSAKFGAAIKILKAKFKDLATGALDTAVQNAWAALMGKS